MKRTKLILLVAAAALAACQSAPGRRTIQAPGASPNAVFSSAVESGGLVFLSGKLGIDPETGAIPPVIEDEVRLIMDGLADVLAAADLTMDDMVSVTVFCTDPALYDRFNAVYRTYFTDGFPARAFIGSGPLLRGAHFEVKGIAARSR